MSNADIETPIEDTEALDQQARTIIRTSLNTNLLVEAGAGSGKTTELVNRMLGLIKSGTCTIEQLAAVTYTRKAAAELRDRFELELAKELQRAETETVRKRLQQAIRHFSRASIGTVHSFCARLLRERPIEAGVDLNFRELEEEQTSRIIERAWNNFVAASHLERKELVIQARELSFQLDDLNSGFFCYVRNADIENWPTALPQAVSFTQWLGENEIARQLTGFLQRIVTLAERFPPEGSRGSDKAMAYYESLIRTCLDRDLSQIPELIDCLENFTKESVKPVQRYWPGGQDSAKREESLYKALYQDVIVPARNYLFGLRYALAIQCFRDAHEQFKKLKQEMRVLDFQDLLILTARMLRESPDVRAYLRDRYTHLLVDEFQDTDPLQAEIMFLLTAEDPNESDWRNCHPRPGSLFVVGDPKQSIYRFKRGDIQTYVQVKQRIAAAGMVCSLTRNFRTCGEIIDWCNQTFQGKFPPEPTDESPVYEPMAAARVNANQAGESNIGLRLLVCKEDDKSQLVVGEATFIARQVKKMLDEQTPIPRKASELEAGLPLHVVPSDFLIILPLKASLDFYADQLRNLGLPVQVTGGSAYAAGVAELELLRDLLVSLNEPENPIALVAVLRGRLFGINDEELYNFHKAGKRFNFNTPISDNPEQHPAIARAFGQLTGYAQYLRTLPFITALQRIAEESGLLCSALVSDSGTSAGTVMLALEKLRELQADAWSPVQLTALLDELIEQRLEADSLPLRDQGGAAIRVMNLHRAKGLEAPIVFLANPVGEFEHDVSLAVDRTVEGSTGYLAIQKKNGYQSLTVAQPYNWDEKAAAEKRFLAAEKTRLRYVAATRAGVQLIVSVNQSKSRLNPWSELVQAIPNDSANQLNDPGPQTRPQPNAHIEMELTELAESVFQIESRRSHLLAPTYAEISARELEPGKSSRRPVVTEASEYKGAEWGTLLHQLLETAARVPQADLQSLAESLAEEAGLSMAVASAAVDTIQAVMRSDFWKRVQAAEKVLVEVPFTVWEPAKEETEHKPLLVRGVIDLVFREPAGWVICDYKSDDINPDGLPALVETYRGQIETYCRYWKTLVKDPVIEVGLFSTRLNQFQRLE